MISKNIIFHLGLFWSIILFILGGLHFYYFKVMIYYWFLEIYFLDYIETHFWFLHFWKFIKYKCPKSHYYLMKIISINSWPFNLSKGYGIQQILCRNMIMCFGGFYWLVVNGDEESNLYYKLHIVPLSKM